MTGITRILVPTDFSPASDQAIASARMLAGRFGASLHIVHAFDEPFTAIAFASELTSALPLSLRDELLRDSVRRLKEQLPPDQKTYFRGTTEILSGRPAPAILDAAERLGADLIVIGSHGRTGMANALLGSVADRVVRAATVPVVTLRSELRPDITRILVPTDFSQTADEALDQAFLFADRCNASLHLLHVIDDPSMTDEPFVKRYPDEGLVLRMAVIRAARRRLAQRAKSHPAWMLPVPVQIDVRFGPAAPTIAAYCAERDVDLIVMGTHGRSCFAHLLLGSVAERLLRSAPCPVLTVRHPQARQPAAELVYELNHIPA